MTADNVSEQSALERLLDQAEAQIERNPTGSCVDCYGADSVAPEKWPHFPGCYATVNKALDLALARIAELERERDEARVSVDELRPYARALGRVEGLLGIVGKPDEDECGDAACAAIERLQARKDERARGASR